MRIYFILFLSLSLPLFSYEHAIFYPEDQNEQPEYLTVSNTPYLSLISPHLIPYNHPIKPILDSIFSYEGVNASRETLEDAGFTILYARQSSFALVAQHPAMPGYLFKIYPDSATARNGRAGWKWLVDRCIGAALIRKVIKKKKLRFFKVPDKWLYLVPHQTDALGKPIQQPVILIAKDMQIVTNKETSHAWKTVITEKHLDELYSILSRGYGSVKLPENIPYIGNGQFAFIDTEYPKRKLSLKDVSPRLSKKAKAYWEELID